MGNRLPDVSVDCRVGPYRLIGTLGNRYERGILLTRYAKLKAKDLLCTWLHHLLAGICGEPFSHTLLLMKDMKARFESTNQTGSGLEDLIDIFVHGKKICI